ncbi:MAG TPA: iron-containing alcohol dehydrogenase [Vicinamibacterales bacterium]
MNTPFDFHARTRIVFGPGASARLGELAAGLGASHAFLVADRGMVQAGYVERAVKSLEAAGLRVSCFHAFGENPDSDMIAAGRDEAAGGGVDLIVGLGGGSSLDCAKGINFLVTNGGDVADYRGYGKATRPMLPMIGIPTTAGTGSEAQSYAVLSDARTHEKMACGAPGAAFRIAILDPELTLTAPPAVTAAAGMDAIAHAIETWVTTKRNALSDLYSREAWRLLSGNFLRVLNNPGDLEARAAMQVGAYFAGAAIEASMLGATHACANPLTKRYGTVHGVAIALLLPHVVRWNSGVAGRRYAELAAVAGDAARAEALAARLEDFVAAGRFPDGLRAAGVPERDLPALAEEAARQWTGTFNPRPFDAAGALEIYAAAY